MINRGKNEMSEMDEDVTKTKTRKVIDCGDQVGRTKALKVIDGQIALCQDEQLFSLSK